jgi:hypothetical protein
VSEKKASILHEFLIRFLCMKNFKFLNTENYSQDGGSCVLMTSLKLMVAFPTVKLTSSPNDACEWNFFYTFSIH